MNKLRIYNLQLFGIKRWVLEDETILTMPRYNLCVIAPQKNESALKQLKTLLKAKSELSFFNSKEEFLAYAKENSETDSNAQYCLIQVVPPQSDLSTQLINAEEEKIKIVLYLYSDSWAFLQNSDSRNDMLSSIRSLARGFVDYTPIYIDTVEEDTDKIYLTVYLLVDKPFDSTVLRSLEVDFNELDIICNIEQLDDPNSINTKNLDANEFIAIINLAERPLPIVNFLNKLIFYIHTSNIFNIQAQNPSSHYKWITEVIHSFTGIHDESLQVYFDPEFKHFYQGTTDLNKEYPLERWREGINKSQTNINKQQDRQGNQNEHGAISGTVVTNLPFTMSTKRGFMLAIAFVGADSYLTQEIVANIEQFFGLKMNFFESPTQLIEQLNTNKQIRVGIITNQEFPQEFFVKCNYGFCISLSEYSQLVNDSRVFTACQLLRELNHDELFKQHLNFRKV